jgi:glycerol-3-phosphate dehydrogenase (NAD(P)+)
MMGSALCVPLVDHGHQVRLVGTHLDDEIIESLLASRIHPKLGLELPRDLEPYPFAELDQALRGAELIGVGVSSPGVRWAGHQLARYSRSDLPIVMITKGLELGEQGLLALPDVLRGCLGPETATPVHPAAVAGPCIAGELAQRTPTCVMLTGRDARVLEHLAAQLRTPYYHVWTSTDLIGVEVCAALKNAYAMGIAFALGLHEQRGGAAGSVAMHNYESAVFAQSVVEMQRVVTRLGGNAETAAALPGVGDLDVTCNGGRTGRFGRWLGLGLSPAAAIERMEGATLECLDILRVMREAVAVLERQGVLQSEELPLLRHLWEVALDGAPVAVPFERFFAG